MSDNPTSPAETPEKPAKQVPKFTFNKQAMEQSALTAISLNQSPQYAFLKSGQLRFASWGQADTQEAGFDAGAGRYKVVDFNHMANHIAWRVAHFIDEGRFQSGQSHKGRSFEDFVSYMERTGISVMLLDVPAEKDGQREQEEAVPTLCYGDTTLSGYVLTSDQICPLVSKEVIESYFNTPIPKNDFLLDTLTPEVVPLSEDATRPSWAYNPSSTAKEYRSKVIEAAMTAQGLLGRFRPKGLGDVANPYDAFFGAQLLSRQYDKDKRRWVEAPYSKTYRPINTDPSLPAKAGTGVSPDLSDIVLERETNTKASLYTIKSVGAETLEDYLDAIYAGGGCTIHGKQVFLDKDFIGRRIIKPKMMSYNTEGKSGYLQKVPQNIQDAFEKVFPEKKAEDFIFESVTLPTILPAPTRVFAIDVDGLAVPEGWNIYKREAEAIDFIKSKLPAALRDCKMTIHFTSSFCFRNDEDKGGYVFTDTPEKVSCRLWFVADEPMKLSDFGDFVVHHVENADPAIYSPNQPIYGDPSFIGMDDPLEGKRRITVEGRPCFNVKEVKAKVTRIHEEIDKTHLMALQNPAQASQFLNTADIDPDLEGIERSRALVTAKLAHLGDRHAMASLAKCQQEANSLRTHFSFLRNVIVGHLYAVYRDFPDIRPLSIKDLTSPERQDALTEEVQFLMGAMGHAFRQAALDPRKETDFARTQEYGVTEQGVIPQGKLATLVLDANQEIAQKMRANFQSLKRTILHHAAHNTKLPREVFQDYISGFTYPTTVEPSGHSMKAEAFTGTAVFANDQGLLINDPSLSPSERVATFSGEDRFHWVGVSDTTKIPDFWKEGEISEIMSDLTQGVDASSKVFCHNCTIEEVRDQLPQRTASGTSFGSKSIAKITLTQPILPKEIKRLPTRAELEEKAPKPPVDVKADLPKIPKLKVQAIKDIFDKTKDMKKGSRDI